MNILDLKRQAQGWMARGLGADTEGGADVGVGGEGTSQGNATAAGNAEMGGYYGESSNDTAQRANEIASQLSVDPLDALMSASGAYGTVSSTPGSISPGGFSYGELSMLNDLGYGSMVGINPNNPTQSIAEAIASNNAHGWLNEYASTLPAMMGAPIGLTSAFNFGLNLARGKQTVGQSLAGSALSAAAKSMGVPAGVLSSALAGNFGAAAASAASQAALGALTSATGLPGSVVGMIAKESGLLGEFNSAVSGAVNNATGNLSTGFSAKGLADAIDGAIGSVNSGFGGTYGGEGSPGAGSSGGAEPGVMDFTNPFTPTETLDAPGIPQMYQGASAAMAPVSYGENAAAVGGAYDPFQDFIAMPVRGTTQDESESLKYLRAAEGGSIEDLAEYLRS